MAHLTGVGRCGYSKKGEESRFNDHVHDKVS
jgi:hypothetical protein